MQTVSSDIFVFGKNLPIEQDYLAFASINEAKISFENAKSPLTIVDWDQYIQHGNSLFEILNSKKLDPFPIFYSSPENIDALLLYLENISFSAIVSKQEPHTLQRHVLMALEKARLKKQEYELLTLMESQNKEIEVVTQSLENKKQKMVEEITMQQERLEITTKKLEATGRLIVALYTADSIGQMEALVFEALRYAIPIEQVKLVLSNTPWSEAFAESVSTLKFSIRTEEQKLGDIYFISLRPLSKSNEAWLAQITEMVAVAVDRWLSIERGLQMKDNWEASFRSIQSRVAVIDENYNLLAYNKENQKDKCYKVLFGLENPCFGCKLGKHFQVTHLDRKDNDLHIFDVSSKTQFDEVEEEVFVNVYEDVTRKARQGRERVEAAKLTELGIIGSSIAHELNNPLSGVLSYIQILLTEVSETEELHSILLQMEEGAKRCRQIIQNLLGFTRFSSAEEFTDVEVDRVIEKALLFLETKSRSLGVSITLETKSNVSIRGSENLLIQAVLEVIKNSLEEFTDILLLTPNYQPKLSIRQSQNASSVIIDIIDNGRGIPSEFVEKVFTPLFTLKNPSHNRGLGLTTAYQILQTMKGRIEIFSAFPTGVQVRIVLPAKSDSN